MKLGIIAIAAVTLAACAAAEGREAEVVSGSAGEVSVRAPDGVDPAPAAAAHCRQYGKTAVRRLVTPIPVGDAPGAAIYLFGCQ
jgi:hypothetical protein